METYFDNQLYFVYSIGLMMSSYTKTLFGIKSGSIMDFHREIGFDKIEKSYYTFLKRMIKEYILIEYDDGKYFVDKKKLKNLISKQPVYITSKWLFFEYPLNWLQEIKKIIIKFKYINNKYKNK